MTQGAVVLPCGQRYTLSARTLSQESEHQAPPLANLWQRPIGPHVGDRSGIRAVLVGVPAVRF